MGRSRLLEMTEMDAPFNPFQSWLQHPLSTQSLSFYQLVGLDDFEGRPDKITAACDKAIATVRACKPGSQAKLWARLLDVLQQIKGILTSADRRSGYDQKLKAGATNAFVSLASLTQTAQQESTKSTTKTAVKPAMEAKSSQPVSVAKQSVAKESAASESVSDLLPPSADLPPEADGPDMGAPVVSPVMPIDPNANPYPGYGQPGAYPQSPGSYVATGYPGAYPHPGYQQPQVPYGQPGYPQPAYGQPAYGQAAYGQPGYPQSPYGQPAYPQPGAPWQQPGAGVYPGYPGGPEYQAMGTPVGATMMPTEPSTGVAPISTVKSSIARRKGSNKSKGIALLVCSTLLLITVGGGVYWVFNQGMLADTVQKGGGKNTVADDDKNSQRNSVPVDPTDDDPKTETVSDTDKGSNPAWEDKNKAVATVPSEETSTEEEMPNEETSSEEASTEEMPSDTSAEEMTTEEGDPESEPSEETNPDEEMKPEEGEEKTTAKPTDEPSEEPTEEMPSGEPLTEEELAELSKLLNDAKAALAKFEFPKLDEFIPAAEKLARTPETKGLVDRLSNLATHAAECRSAIVEAIQALKGGDEVELKNTAKTRFSVVEVGPNKFLIRMNGNNRNYTYDNLPMGLAMGMADRRLSTSDPSNLARKGAYLAVMYWADRSSPKPLQEAKEMFSEAKLGGVDTDALEAVLEDDYDSLTAKK